jgi:hypothetical protein
MFVCLYVQVYLDVGMDPATVIWANARIAPIQVSQYFTVHIQPMPSIQPASQPTIRSDHLSSPLSI